MSEFENGYKDGNEGFGEQDSYVRQDNEASVWAYGADPAEEQKEQPQERFHYSREGAGSSGTGFSPNRPDRKSRKKSGGNKILKIIASAFLFGLIAGATMIGVEAAKDRFFPSSITQIETTDKAADSTEESTEKADNDSNTAAVTPQTSVTTTDVSGVVQQVMPSVVSITSTITSSNYFYGTTQSQGAGSGFILSKDADKLYIATNNHVVADATALTVGFADGSTAEAEIVGTDSDADLAVISVKAENISKETASVIKVAVLGNSDSLKVGEPVIAIGNALGYGQSVTTGVVSAKDREVSFTDGTMVLLQTDAAINPGNSGGVLINQRGEVIGINNAKLEDTSVEGMGYAIPITTAKGILDDLKNATNITEDKASFLGVVGRTIDSTYSETLSMPTGIYVTQVISGSPAEQAGISAGDIIVAFDGNKVSTMEGLKAKLARKAAGTKIKLTVKRADQNGEYGEQTIEVTLGKKSDFADASTNLDNQEEGRQEQGNGNQDNGGYYFNNPYDFFFGNGNW